MALDLIAFTKDLVAELENKNTYMTHVYIAYKVIIYYENNFGKISNEIKPKLMAVIEDIYESYTLTDESELLDNMVSYKLNKL